jgi:uncharacterized protein YndB with AHSA1/START domain
MMSTEAMAPQTTPPDTLTIERVFPHSPEKLWRALTESHLIAEWLMKNDFEPTVGHKFRLQSQPMPQWDGVIECEVQTVEPLEKLSYTWTTLGLPTVVVFTLTAEDGGTKLRMEQTGFAKARTANYQGAKYGWQRFLDGLESTMGGMQ